MADASLGSIGPGAPKGASFDLGVGDLDAIGRAEEEPHSQAGDHRGEKVERCFSTRQNVKRSDEN